MYYKTVFLFLVIGVVVKEANCKFSLFFVTDISYYVFQGKVRVCDLKQNFIGVSLYSLLLSRYLEKPAKCVSGDVQCSVLIAGGQNHNASRNYLLQHFYVFPSTFFKLVDLLFSFRSIQRI